MWTCTLFLQASVFMEGFLSAHNECLGVLLLGNHGISVPTRFLQKAGVDVALHLAKRLSTLRLEDATASVQKDKDMPLSLTRKLLEKFWQCHESKEPQCWTIVKHWSTTLRDDTSWSISRRKHQCFWGLTAWCLKCRVDLKPWIAMWRATSLRQPDFKGCRSNVAMTSPCHTGFKYASIMITSEDNVVTCRFWGCLKPVSVDWQEWNHRLWTEPLSW